uniref:Movement protein TGBp3 n=1 Tax=Potato virus M TaxID=12167 RepID=A0A291FJ75_9VIRU|nr:triple gene block protein 3 [Potato virus M]
MIEHILIGLSAFLVALFVISLNQSGCTVLITGESVRLLGCPVTQEFSRAVSELKPIVCASFRSRG